jgi:GxxExxY protein
MALHHFRAMPTASAINLLTSKIIGCAIAVHKALGPGLLESAYRACLVAELRHAGLRVDEEVRLPIVYRGLTIDCSYRIDLVVEGTVILEIKAVSVVLPIHEVQLVTYLKLAGKPVGLLLNFNVPVMKDGIVRKINTQN